MRYSLQIMTALTALAAIMNLSAQAVSSDKLSKSSLSPVTLSVFSVQNQSLPPDDNRIYKLIQDKLGVSFTWDVAVGNKDQKIGVMIASQDYPDLLDIDSNKFIEAGACIPLEDLIEKYAPNIKRHYQADPTVWAKMHEKDGHIYCLPNWGVNENGVTATYYASTAMWIQKAVLKEFGYPRITTVDEYFDLIAKYKARHPTTSDGKPTIGFSIATQDWHAFALINPPEFLAGFPNDGNGVVDPKTHAYRVHLYGPEAKRWFKLLNAANGKGLLDKDCFVDSFDQYMAKLANGQVLGIDDQGWHFQDSQTALIAQNKLMETMMPLPVVFDKGIRPRYRDAPLPNLQRGYAISIKAKDPVRIIKFMDAQLADDWQHLLAWGELNVDYSLDAKGHPARTQAQRDQQTDPTWQLHNKAQLWYSEAPKVEGRFKDGNTASIGDSPSEYLASQKPEDIEIFKAYKVNSYAELMDANVPPNPTWYPAWQITPPDGSPAQLAWAKADQAYRKYLPKIVLGSPASFEAGWKQYTDALAASDIKTYEAFVQAGIDERIAKFGSKK